MPPVVDLSGKRFGMLRVLSYQAEATAWLCLCDCGVEKLIPGRRLRCGQTRSCGCNWRKWHSPVERFWKKVDVSGGPTACWLWTGSDTGGHPDRRTPTPGYGRLWVGGRLVLAHRFSYELHYTKVADDKLVCHHCDNPPCVNPTHLFVGTGTDNLNDSIKKGRRSRLLAVDAVRRIRVRFAVGGSVKELCQEFNTYRDVIGRIVRGESYRGIA